MVGVSSPGSENYLFLPFKAYPNSEGKTAYHLSCRLTWKTQAGTSNADKLNRLPGILVIYLDLRKFPLLRFLGFASFKGQKPLNRFQVTGFWDPQVHS